MTTTRTRTVTPPRPLALALSRPSAGCIKCHKAVLLDAERRCRACALKRQKWLEYMRAYNRLYFQNNKPRFRTAGARARQRARDTKGQPNRCKLCLSLLAFRTNGTGRVIAECTNQLKHARELAKRRRKRVADYRWRHANDGQGLAAMRAAYHRNADKRRAYARAYYYRPGVKAQKHARRLARLTRQESVAA